MSKNLLKRIISTGLLVGTLDISAAIVQTFVNGGKPVKMFQYIASGVFGQASFSGGLLFALYGLVFHYVIAFIWTFLFFLLYPRLNFMSKNRVLTGMGYGVFIWVIMNHLVLPLSNVSQSPFRLIPSLVAILVLVLAIGLPLSFIAASFFSTKQKRGRS